MNKDYVVAIFDVIVAIFFLYRGITVGNIAENVVGVCFLVLAALYVQKARKEK